MVKEKLPKELKTKQSEVQVLEDVINNPNISHEYLQDLQTKVSSVEKTNLSLQPSFSPPNE